VVEGLASVGEAVDAIGRMSRLQAVLSSEESRGALRAAGEDLRLGVGALAPLAAALPPDAAQDLRLLQRQLAALKFDGGAAEAPLGGPLALALALVQVHAGCPGAGAAAGATLDAAVRRAGLDPAAPSAWLDAEVMLLAGEAREARAAGDSVAEFCALQAALCVAARAAGAWDRLTAAADGIDASGEASANGTHRGEPDLDGCSPTARLLAAHFGAAAVPPLTLELSQAAVQALGAALAVPASSPAPSRAPASPPLHPYDLQAQLDALLTASDAGGASRLRQFQAAALVARAAEAGGPADVAVLLEEGAVPATLACLRGSRHNWVRAAAAAALRHLCREPAGRAAAAAAPGAIALLAQLLQSPSAGVAAGAARALSNVAVAGEGAKEAAAECGAVRSLARMLHADDAPGREAAAACLANLAANSDKLQALLGGTGGLVAASFFASPLPAAALPARAAVERSPLRPGADAIPGLVELLRCGGPAAKQHACRALRNASSRVPANKARAAKAGAAPALAALLHPGAPPALQAAAAGTLAALLPACPPEDAAATARDAAPLLLRMLGEDATAEAAAWAVGALAAAGAEPRATVGGADFVPPLVRLLHGCAGGVGRQAAARAVRALCDGASERAKRALAAAGAVPPLVGALAQDPGEGRTDAGRRAAAAALCALSLRCEANRGAVAAAGGVRALAALLRPAAASEATRQEAARALAVLSSNNAYGQAVRCRAVQPAPWARAVEFDPR
jgi:hypothetical protein